MNNHHNKSILTHVLASKTGIPVARLLKLVVLNEFFFVNVRCKGLGESEETMERLQRV